MDYRTFKKLMAEKDISFGYLHEEDMQKKYEEYLSSMKTGKDDINSNEPIGSLSAKTPYPIKISEVVITDVDMPFSRIFLLCFKLAIAVIPILIVISIIMNLVASLFGNALY